MFSLKDFCAANPRATLSSAIMRYNADAPPGKLRFRNCDHDIPVGTFQTMNMYVYVMFYMSKIYFQDKVD